MTSSRLAQVYEYNQRMREFCERTAGIFWHDARRIVLNRTASTSTVTYNSNYSYDGTHLSQLGGYHWGKSLKALLDAITPTRQSLISSIAELPANGRWQLLDNPLFNTTTGGSSSTGVTGTFPGSCTVNKTGAGTTAACTAASQATSLAINFAAQSDNVRLSQSATLANWSPGDWIQGVCQATITNPSGLAGTQFTMVANGDSANTVISDMAVTSTWAGPDETHTMTYLTDPFQIPAYSSKGSLVPTFYAYAFADGGDFTVSIEQMAIIRRIAGY